MESDLNYLGQALKVTTVEFKHHLLIISSRLHKRSKKQFIILTIQL